MEDMSRKIEIISEAVAGMPYYEWCKIRHAIEQKFSLASMKIVLDAKELETAIMAECK